ERRMRAGSVPAAAMSLPRLQPPSPKRRPRAQPPGAFSFTDRYRSVIVIGRVRERTLVLFLFFLVVLVLILEHVPLFVVFLFSRNRRDVFIDDFVDDDLAVVRHRSAQTAQRASGEQIVVGRTAAARRSGADERCGVVDLFLFLLGLFLDHAGRLVFGFFSLDRDADCGGRGLRETV